MKKTAKNKSPKPHAEAVREVTVRLPAKLFAVAAREAKASKLSIPDWIRETLNARVCE